MKAEEQSPWAAGLRAARRNLVPGLVVQSCMIGLVVAYYQWPMARAWLDVLARWKQSGGYAFSMVSAAISGAILPELFSVLYFQRGEIRPDNTRSLIFGLPFWASQGFMVDLFYRSQAVWFGTSPSLLVLLQKLFVDQFIYSPFYAAPFAVLCFDWHVYGWSNRYLTLGFYRQRVFPTLLANWGVWIPVVLAVYSLPSLLQVPLFALALSFWSLMLRGLTADRAPA